MNILHSKIRWLMLFSLAALITACGDDSPTPTPQPAPTPTQTFEVSITNMTAGQPFSPVAVIAHYEDYATFTLGEPATEALEVLAEGGDNTDFLAEADDNADVLATESGENPLAPGATETISMEFDEDQLAGLMFSVMTMLVNTNDAITAVTSSNLEGMSVGDSQRLTAITYDVGTEANTELAGSIPGPADGGEGFNAARDDSSDQVLMHAGILSDDDGLISSRLLEIHRWDNPVMQLMVTRVE